MTVIQPQQHACSHTYRTCMLAVRVSRIAAAATGVLSGQTRRRLCIYAAQLLDCDNGMVNCALLQGILNLAGRLPPSMAPTVGFMPGVQVPSAPTTSVRRLGVLIMQLRSWRKHWSSHEAVDSTASFTEHLQTLQTDHIQKWSYPHLATAIS